MKRKDENGGREVRSGWRFAGETFGRPEGVGIAFEANGNNHPAPGTSNAVDDDAMTRDDCRRLGLLLVLLAGTAGLASAGETKAVPVPSASAAPTTGTISVDGRLSEEAWLGTPAVIEFVQRSPNEGRPASERTEVRVIYDGDALYVGARLFDSRPDGIIRRLSRRDGDSSSDVFRVYLDPHHDHNTGVLFRVAADGSLADSWLSDDFSRDASWDGVWEAATAVDAEGWTVEMRIPFSQLRFSPGASQIWGFNVSRYIQRKNEESWWVLVPSNDTRLVSAFGHLDGLRGIGAQRHLELLPYATMTVERIGTAEQGDPFNAPNRVGAGAGLDVKWGMTSSFTLDGAINPDFGQVEVDPAVVNLTAFETFFQEKRPFFIEGSQQFASFGRSGLILYGRFGARYPTLWYSRRIGRSPRLEADGDYVSEPMATTILGAAKVTGQTASGWNMSFVDAVTDCESARVALGDARTTVDVEPLTNYLAARASREMRGRGKLGFLATSVNRSLQTDALRRTAGSGAYVGGVDGNLFLDAKKEWVLAGSVAASHVTGDAAAIASLQRSSARYYQRPDATHVRFDPSATSLSGWTGQLNVNRTRGNLLVDGAVWAISPGFEANDVGFSPAADRVGAHTGWLWQKTTPDNWTRDRSLVLITRWLWNTAGDNLLHGYSLQGSATLRNYWNVSANWDFDLPHFDDRETRGGPLERRPASYTASAYVSSDSRKRVGLNLNSYYAWNTAGGWSLSASPALSIRPSPSMSLSAGPSLTRARAVAQYVTARVDPEATATYGRRTIFSDMDRTEVSMDLRLNAIFTPKVSLEVYAQPLVSSGRYWGLKEFARPRTFEFTRYGTDAGTISYNQALNAYLIDPDASGPASSFAVANPDFRYTSLRVNAIFRWEWRLGSTVYAVWSQQREDSGTEGRFGLMDDLRALARAPGDHVFMVKLAYWLGR